MEKWLPEDDVRANDRIDYFNSQWLKQNYSLYEVFADRYPSTNNAIEATNVMIKAKYILRELLPISQFLNNYINLVQR